MFASPPVQTKITQLPVVSRGRAEYAEIDGAWMIIDLVNSTSWYVSLDKMTAFSLLRDCLEGMGEIVKQHEGEIVKLTGDGLHARFPRPLDALRCAVAYHNSMTSLSDSSFPCCPKARIGLSVGPCIQCKICECVDYYGYAVLLATRLAQEGSCDEIVMCDEFVSRTGVAEMLETTPVETSVCGLKGFPQPLKVHRVHFGDLQC